MGAAGSVQKKRPCDFEKSLSLDELTVEVDSLGSMDTTRQALFLLAALDTPRNFDELC